MKRFVFSLFSLLTLFLLFGCTFIQNGQNEVALKTIESLDNLKTVQFQESIVSKNISENNSSDITFTTKINKIDLVNKKAYFLIMSSSPTNAFMPSTSEIYVVDNNQYTKVLASSSQLGEAGNWIKSDVNVQLNEFVINIKNIINDWNLVSVTDSNVGEKNAFLMNFSNLKNSNILTAQIYVSKENYFPLMVLTEEKIPLGVLIEKSTLTIESFDTDIYIALPKKASEI